MNIKTPLSDDVIEKLKAGDRVYLSGIIYTARDSAHKRLCDAIDNGKTLPFDVRNKVIYYVGPTPAKPGALIGSAGPTTSIRMDAYTPKLIANGLKGMIGKGFRTDTVIKAIKMYKAVYFGAIGGTGALLSKKIKSVKIIAYEDLGTEAIRELVVENFPLFVINDIYGNDLYKSGAKKYHLL